jgi:hypothetical protein
VHVVVCGIRSIMDRFRSAAATIKENGVPLNARLFHRT